MLAEMGAIHSTQALVVAELVVDGLTELSVEGHWGPLLVSAPYNAPASQADPPVKPDGSNCRTKR
jgi:hypothetical protein